MTDQEHVQKIKDLHVAPEGGVVLDPFMGSGTTAYVAQENMRKYLGCELNESYGELQKERLKQMVMI